MAKPRGNSSNPVSLFPFLSILACVIGTLILLIASLAITQMQSDPEEELVERVDEYKELEASNQELDKTIEDLLPKLASLEALKRELEKLKQEVADLKAKRQQHHDEHKELQDKLDELAKQKLAIQKELEELKRKRAAQDQEIARLEAEIDKRRMVNSAPTVRVEPGEGGGHRRGTIPVFVEVNKKGLVLDPGGTRTEVPASKLTSDAGFTKLLDSLSGNANKTLVMLIREDGYRVYPTAEYIARTHNVIVSKLPIVGEGQLDLSRF